MGVTIVIVNWNGGVLLQRCLQSVRDSRQSFPVKVIVVDNDSTDGSREAAVSGFPEFKIFNSGANLGFGRANNLARSMVETPLVLFLNPDTELREDTLERAVQCLRDHPDVGLVGCKMLYPAGEVQQQGLQWLPSVGTILLEFLLTTHASRRYLRRLLPTFDPNQSTYVRKLYGGFLLIRKEVMDAAGWFDERYFMYAEDVDLSRTVADLGWKLYYCAEAAIIHDCGGASVKAPSGFSILMKNRSINQYLWKYQGRMAALVHRLVVFTGSTLRLLTLLVLNMVSGGGPVGRSRRCGSLFKQTLAILWAVGLRKPAIPGAIGSPTTQSSGDTLGGIS